MSANPPHLLLVEALFYEHIAADLRRGAERAVAEAGATCEVVSVPGAFEIPGAIALAARAGGGAGEQQRRGGDEQAGTGTTFCHALLLTNHAARSGNQTTVRTIPELSG